MSDCLTWTAADVAKALGIARETFYRVAPELRTAHGFPTPLPGLRVYDRQAVLDWLARQRTPAAEAAAMPRDILAERARAMGADTEQGD